MTLSGRKHKVTTSMRRLSPDASSPWSVGRSDERCERNVHSTYFHTKPSVSERLYGLRYHLRPLFHLYITHISQSHDPRNRLPQGSDRATTAVTWMLTSIACQLRLTMVSVNKLPLT
jgi:hypothetical protein